MGLPYLASPRHYHSHPTTTSRNNIMSLLSSCSQTPISRVRTSTSIKVSSSPKWKSPRSRINTRPILTSTTAVRIYASSETQRALMIGTTDVSSSSNESYTAVGATMHGQCDHKLVYHYCASICLFRPGSSSTLAYDFCRSVLGRISHFRLCPFVPGFHCTQLI